MVTFLPVISSVSGEDACKYEGASCRLVGLHLAPEKHTKYIKYNICKKTYLFIHLCKL